MKKKTKCISSVVMYSPEMLKVTILSRFLLLYGFPYLVSFRFLEIILDFINVRITACINSFGLYHKNSCRAPFPTGVSFKYAVYEPVKGDGVDFNICLITSHLD